MGFWIVLAALPLIAIIGIVVLIVFAAKNAKNHPSELSSESRNRTRGIRDSVASLERLVGDHSDRTEVKVIGPEAVDAAKRILKESMSYAKLRDELAPIARRENGVGRASEAIQTIDSKLLEAESVVGDMVTRIGEGKIDSLINSSDEGFESMVKRLESLGQSMDESRETLGVRLP